MTVEENKVQHISSLNLRKVHTVDLPDYNSTHDPVLVNRNMEVGGRCSHIKGCKTNGRYLAYDNSNTTYIKCSH